MVRRHPRFTLAGPHGVGLGAVDGPRHPIERQAEDRPFDRDAGLAIQLQGRRQIARLVEPV